MAMTPIIWVALCMLALLTSPTESERVCSLEDRMNPKGFCGQDLVNLRDNFCRMYREDFPRKRNAGNEPFAPLEGDRLDEMEDLLDLLGREEGWDQAFAAPPAADVVVRKLFGLGNHHSSNDHHQVAVPGRPYFQKRSLEDLPVMQKRGIVCDCCYNRCMPSTLAQYCP